MDEFIWYSQNSHTETWCPMSREHNQELNEFLTFRIKTGILSEKLIEADMETGQIHIVEDNLKVPIMKARRSEKIKVLRPHYLFSKTNFWLARETFDNLYREDEHLFKASLNHIFGTSLKGLFDVEFYFHKRYRSNLNLNNLEDYKSILYNLYPNNDTIKSITIENMPEILIKLLLSEGKYPLQSFDFQSYLLRTALKVISSENVIKVDSDKMIFYRVGYLTNDDIKCLTVDKYYHPTETFLKHFIAEYTPVTKDYKTALYILNLMGKEANCIFEFQFEDEEANQSVFSLDKYLPYFEEDVYLISSYIRFFAEKIIKYENMYKIVLRFYNKIDDDMYLRKDRRIYIDEMLKLNEINLLKKNKDIRYFTISAYLEKEVVKPLFDIILKNKLNPDIKFYNPYLIAGGNIKYLIHLLNNNKYLQGINRNFNELQPLTSLWVDPLDLPSYLSNKTLIELNLSSYHMSQRGCELISYMIGSFEALQILSIPCCGIGNENIKIITEKLKTNNTITDICLNSNGIDDVGLRHICEVLEVNKTLELVNLKRNLISSRGLSLLADALERNVTLIEIFLQGNPCPNNDLDLFVETFKLNKFERKKISYGYEWF
jgi:hypothetical protein